MVPLDLPKARARGTGAWGDPTSGTPLGHQLRWMLTPSSNSGVKWPQEAEPSRRNRSFEKKLEEIYVLRISIRASQLHHQ
jgi:hypothetical protein